MKKLVSKLLGCLIAFTPVSSFNSNNYSYADLSSDKRVLTEQEFDDICHKIDEELRNYINHYWEAVKKSTKCSRIAHGFILSQLNGSKQLKLGNRINFLDKNMSMDDARIKILGYNYELPVAVCRHFSLYFARKYFSPKNVQYSAILDYGMSGDDCHVFLVGCYINQSTKKIEYVAIDPMAHCNFLAMEKEAKEELESGKINIEYFNERRKSAYMQLFHICDELPEDYMYPAYSKIDNYKKFLKIPLDIFYLYSVSDAVNKILTNENEAEFGDAKPENSYKGWTDLNDVINKMYPFSFLYYQRKLNHCLIPARRKMSYFNCYGMPRVYRFLSDPTLFDGFSKY